MSAAFPTDAFAILAEALRTKTFSLKALKAASTVISWALESFGDLFGKPAAAGTLSSSVLLTDDEAATHFERLSGEGSQAALDPALLRMLLTFLANKLLERLAK
jgi:hypothetical protein